MCPCSHPRSFDENRKNSHVQVPCAAASCCACVHGSFIIKVVISVQCHGFLAAQHVCNMSRCMRDAMKNVICNIEPLTNHQSSRTRRRNRHSDVAGHAMPAAEHARVNRISMTAQACCVARHRTTGFIYCQRSEAARALCDGSPSLRIMSSYAHGGVEILRRLSVLRAQRAFEVNQGAGMDPEAGAR
jgi:hypothetical protein